jgi:hypothetical protein
MDCENARLLVSFAHPHLNELDPVDAEALESHLADCPGCATLAQQQRRLDHQLGRAMRQVEVPTTLRSQILARLAQDNARPVQRWWVHGARILGAAAALALLVWGWWQWQRSRQLTIDVGEVYSKVNHPHMNRDGVTAGFARLGMKTTLPDLDYAYLSCYGVGELPGVPGRKVPLLVFYRPRNEENGGARALVYILSAEKFDLDSLPERPGFDEGYDFNLQIRRPPSGGHAYLIFYTGNDIDWLRRR